MKAKVKAILLLLVIVGVCVWQRPRPPKAAPNIDALKASLERSARATLPAPEVANEKVTVVVAKDAVAGEMEKILRLAAADGGTAVKSTTGATEILASIPANAAAKFTEEVAGKPSGVSVKPGENELIDVFITPR